MEIDLIRVSQIDQDIITTEMIDHVVIHHRGITIITNTTMIMTMVILHKINGKETQTDI